MFCVVFVLYMTPIDKFKNNLNDFGIEDTNIEVDNNKVYIYVPESGFGIPTECYTGVDVNLIESIGMSSLSTTHSLYDESYHHILIFKVH